MIFVGEIEFNKPQYYPDGFAGFLYIGMSSYLDPQGKQQWYYHYSISPSPYPQACRVGDNYTSVKNLSVPEFLQGLVDSDELIGRGVIHSFKEAKVRLKGMTEWIERKQPVEEVK